MSLSSLRNMGCGSEIRDHGSRGQKSTGSRIRIRNTGGSGRKVWSVSTPVLKWVKINQTPFYMGRTNKTWPMHLFILSFVLLSVQVSEIRGGKKSGSEDPGTTSRICNIGQKFLPFCFLVRSCVSLLGCVPPRSFHRSGQQPHRALGRQVWPRRNPVLRIRIRDPVPFWPLDPDPGWVESQHPDPGWTTRIIFSKALKPFFWVKIHKFFDADPGSGMETARIRDPGWKKVGSGINIPDPQH